MSNVNLWLLAILAVSLMFNAKSFATWWIRFRRAFWRAGR